MKFDEYKAMYYYHKDDIECLKKKHKKTVQPLCQKTVLA